MKATIFPEERRYIADSVLAVIGWFAACGRTCSRRRPGMLHGIPVSPVVCLPETGDGYLSQATLMGLLQIRSSITLWKWVKEGRFPKPVKVVGNTTNRWSVSDIRAHMQRVRDKVRDGAA